MTKVINKKKIARSYGLLVYRFAPVRGGGEELQFLVVRPAHGDPVNNQSPYYLPKGQPNDEESPEETALREVYEETGIRSRIISSLGTVRYKNGRKEVGIYLAKCTGGNICEDGQILSKYTDLENDDIRFVNVYDARRLLRYEYKEMVDLANKKLAEM